MNLTNSIRRRLEFVRGISVCPTDKHRWHLLTKCATRYVCRVSRVRDICMNTKNGEIALICTNIALPIHRTDATGQYVWLWHDAWRDDFLWISCLYSCKDITKKTIIYKKTIICCKDNNIQRKWSYFLRIPCHAFYIYHFHLWYDSMNLMSLQLPTIHVTM